MGVQALKNDAPLQAFKYGDGHEGYQASRVACPACESRDTGLYLSGHGDRGRDIERSFIYYLCSRCRLRFQPTTPEEARGQYADVQDVARRTRPTARRELRCDDDALRTLGKLLAGRRLLNVGSGDGWFLAAGRAAGLDCTGTDVSERLAEAARRRSGAPVLVGELAELDLPPNSFDLINLDEVLMYVADPRSLFNTLPDCFGRAASVASGSLMQTAWRPA
jgi:SAM-dependent methyltransferase